MVPPVVFLDILLTVAAFLVVGMLLYSCGQLSTQKHHFPFGALHFDMLLKAMGYYHCFGLFWILTLTISTVDFIIAGAVCIWYFQQGVSGQENVDPLRESIHRYFRYHFGTVVLGSILLSLIAFLQIFLEWIYVTLPSYHPSRGIPSSSDRASAASW